MFFRYSGTLQVIPRADTVMLKGRASSIPSTPFYLSDASVQPAEDHEIQTLPEGRRSKGALRVYTGENLTALTSTQIPDHIIVNGVEYEIMSKNMHKNGLINHYKYLIVEVK